MDQKNITLFNDILINPQTGEKLRIDWENESVGNIDQEGFVAKIENNIPIILPRKVSQGMGKTRLHEKAHSEFDYLEHYQKDAEEFDYFFEYESAISRDENNRLHQKIVGRVPKRPNIILDVGCGNGWLGKKMVNGNTMVISMDISTVNPIKAIRNHPHPNHLGLVADVFNLPLAEGSVDCIVASEIIEHVADPALFVAKLVRPLKKGGKLIITTPYNEKLEYSLCVHCNRPTPRNAHLHSFNEDNIKRLIPENIETWKHHLFINMIMIKLRLYAIFSFLPFGIWNVMDKAFNKLVKKPGRLMIEITK